MSKQLSKMKIRCKYYDFREYWEGKTKLHEYMKAQEYAVDELCTLINNLFFVYNRSGNMVGKFHTEHNLYSGVLSSFEM